LATRNFTTVLAGLLIASPVAGLVILATAIILLGERIVHYRSLPLEHSDFVPDRELTNSQALLLRQSIHVSRAGGPDTRKSFQLTAAIP
jgi:hypothetical protein